MKKILESFYKNSGPDSERTLERILQQHLNGFFMQSWTNFGSTIHWAGCSKILGRILQAIFGRILQGFLNQGILHTSSWTCIERILQRKLEFWRIQDLFLWKMDSRRIYDRIFKKNARTYSSTRFAIVLEQILKNS